MLRKSTEVVLGPALALVWATEMVRELAPQSEPGLEPA